MKLMLSVVCVALVALCLAEATKTTAATKTCPKCDGVKYDPVCVRMGGSDKEPKLTTFGSDCVLKAYNCEKGATLAIQKKGECPPGSPVRLS